MPKVSIVTPSYNHARFLPARIASILDQTFRDFEWLVIDDFSSDGSPAVLSRHLESEPRARIIVHDRNRGMPATVNEAIGMASGTYVYRAESDDFCEPLLLERLVAVLDERSDTDVAHARTLNLDERGRAWPDPGRGRQDVVIDSDRAFARLTLGNYVAGPSTLFRRQAIEEVGGFAVPPGRIACDWHLLLRIALRSAIGYVAEPLGYHRLHGANMSGATEALLWERYAIVNDVFDHLPPGRHHLSALRTGALRSISSRAGTGLYVRYMSAGRRAEAAAVRHRIEAQDPGSTTGPTWRRACARSVAALVLREAAYPRAVRLLLAKTVPAAAVAPS